MDYKVELRKEGGGVRRRVLSDKQGCAKAFRQRSCCRSRRSSGSWGKCNYLRGATFALLYRQKILNTHTHTRCTWTVNQPGPCTLCQLAGVSLSFSVDVFVPSQGGGFLTKAFKLPNRNQQEPTLIKARQNQHEKTSLLFLLPPWISLARPSGLWSLDLSDPRIDCSICRQNKRSQWGEKQHVAHKMRWKRRKIWKPLQNLAFLNKTYFDCQHTSAFQGVFLWTYPHLFQTINRTLWFLRLRFCGPNHAIGQWKQNLQGILQHLTATKQRKHVEVATKKRQTSQQNNGKTQHLFCKFCQRVCSLKARGKNKGEKGNSNG